eukprot:gene9200-9367_t
MHFVKFETARVDDCLDFIQAKGLHRCMLKDGSSREVRVKATGGGAMRFGDVFKERLGLVLEREDEIGCAVGGCNFLLRTITHEAFAFEAGQAQFVPCSEDSELFPYLLVNIGSGVSIIRVDGPGEGEYCRVSGSSVGGGTFWGLCRLLTGLRDFDAMLELSMQGNNANVDMLVGDIYGGRDYSAIGLSASTIACSFGKVVGQDKELQDYNPADVAMSLCRMVAYNIGQLAFMHAKRYDLKRVFFGGFFIRGHPYTMETISFAIKFWSQGEMSALFLRHEGFLGAVGAFLKVHPMHVPSSRSFMAAARAAAALRFADRAAGGQAAADSDDMSQQTLTEAGRSVSTKVRARFVERFSMGAPFAGGEPASPTSYLPTRMPLHVGVLHYSPTQEPFPLLADPARRAAAFGRAFTAHLQKLRQAGGFASEGDSQSHHPGDSQSHHSRITRDPGAYGQLGLSDLFEMREECLREFGFSDVYRLDKEAENAVALQGILAANIFDWGAKACVELYTNGTILDIYREVIEGMGRAIHTNLYTPFKCDTLKLAMIKTERLAVKLFGGSLPVVARSHWHCNTETTHPVCVPLLVTLTHLLRPAGQVVVSVGITELGIFGVFEFANTADPSQQGSTAEIEDFGGLHTGRV